MSMKLYVCGAQSANPEQWTVWDEISLVLAETVQQAEELSYKRPVLEVDMSRPCILVSVSEPNWGEDI